MLLVLLNNLKTANIVFFIKNARFHQQFIVIINDALVVLFSSIKRLFALVASNYYSLALGTVSSEDAV
jgi:hypothetical protein